MNVDIVCGKRRSLTWKQSPQSLTKTKEWTLYFQSSFLGKLVTHGSQCIMFMCRQVGTSLSQKSKNCPFAYPSYSPRRCYFIILLLRNTIVMGDSLIPYLASKVEKLADLAYREALLVWGVKHELHKLQSTLEYVKAVILETEQKQSYQMGVRIWRERLAAVLYDSEIVLDEFECEALRKQQVNQGTMRKKVRYFFSPSNPLAFRLKMSGKVKEVRRKLAEIGAEKDAFNLSTKPAGTSRASRRLVREVTHSFVHASDVIGRERDRDAIVKRLMCPDLGKSPFIISIVGMAGLGKTTLAKLVYNDQRVVDHFELRIWIHVSRDFDLKQLMQKVVSSAFHQNIDRLDATHQSLDHLDEDILQRHLREFLKDKKFLLLLDDLWSEKPLEWSEFINLFMDGTEGSIIIVTTRSSKVASTVNTGYRHDLGGLTQESCISLLMKACRQGQDKAINSKLLEIATEIVESCGGLPLVLTALGGLLHSYPNVRYWEWIRNKNIMSLLQDTGDISVIESSYDYLPPHLKRCFTYCSLFPKDFFFGNNSLCSFWIASGLVQTSDENQEPEDEADRCMKDLLARSFFQELEDYVTVYNFKMNRVMHDLALSVGKHEISVVNFCTESVPEGTRHVSFSKTNFNGELTAPVPTFLTKANKLQTLLMFQLPEKGVSWDSFVKAVISKCKHLRALVLEGAGFEVLPSSIGSLKHLRLLILSKNRMIKRLPRSICDLQSLQVLELNGCESLEELPRDMWKLINLRSLHITTKQRSLEKSGVERLKSLRYLWFDGCSSLESLFEGIDLKGLAGLRTLGIEGCKNLTSIPLDGLKSLTSLETLSIGSCEKLDLSVSVVKDFFPSSLRTLMIGGLPCMSTFPEWIRGSAKTLQCIFVAESAQLMALPEWFRNIMHLEVLSLVGCPNISSLPEGLQNLTSLRSLTIANSGKLSERCRPPNGLDWHKIEHIPEIYINYEKIHI